MASRATSGGASAPPIAAPLDELLGAIPSLSRPILARLTARMIDRLDEIDGDENLEDCGDAEEGVDREGPGAPGEPWHAFLPDRPIYGIDQSKGPVNEREAVRAYMRAVQGR